MLIHIDETDPRPLYQQIADEVRRAIVLGTVMPGDAIPSVRQLSSELRVNPTTVQQAFRELEREGLVYVRRGQGTYVRDVPTRVTRREQRRLALMVARRALREADRHGVTVEELAAAIRRATRSSGSRRDSAKGGSRA
jgi:GntR family transcriptional regulator